MGFLMFRSHRYNDGLALNNGSPKIKLNLHEENHPSTLATMNNIACTQEETGNIEEAGHCVESKDVTRKRNEAWEITSINFKNYR